MHTILGTDPTATASAPTILLGAGSPPLSQSAGGAGATTSAFAARGPPSGAFVPPGGRRVIMQALVAREAETLAKLDTIHQRRAARGARPLATTSSYACDSSTNSRSTPKGVFTQGASSLGAATITRTGEPRAQARGRIETIEAPQAPPTTPREPSPIKQSPRPKQSPNGKQSEDSAGSQACSQADSSQRAPAKECLE